MAAELIIKWVIVAFLAYGALVTVGRVGKPAKPTTGGVAVAVVLVQSLIIVALVTLWD